ncbi:MAG: hypothetical protein PHE87_06185 [Victivallaceae bacterium]|nr:hypothetical protein [Victivallaceae bacterium]
MGLSLEDSIMLDEDIEIIQDVISEMMQYKEVDFSKMHDYQIRDCERNMRFRVKRAINVLINYLPI